MHIIVLGGAGAMGRVTVRALSEYDDVEQITIADYNAGRARELAAALQQGNHAGKRLVARQIDVRDFERLCDLIRGADAVLSAIDYAYNLPVLKACIQERVHYADLGGLFHMTRTLMALSDEAEAEGIKVQLGCSDTTPSTAPLVAPYSIRTILDEFTKSPQVFQDGEWLPQAPLSGQEELEFPAPVGRASAVYSLHSECATFPISFR